MAASIGLPESLLERPLPEVPKGIESEPSVFMLLSTPNGAGVNFTALRKVTYKIDLNGQMLRTSQQPPIATGYAELPPLPDGRKGSFSHIPEARASQSGTDLIIRAFARSAAPVREMMVGVKVGKVSHRVRVFGDRVTRYANGQLSFSEPELFTEMPLRYELAYGGYDSAFFGAVCDALRAKLGDEEWRRNVAFFRDALPKTVPCVYARNLIGKGYLADVTEALLDGVELPNLEREDDLLTPARFSRGSALDWLQRPIPAGFDFFDIRMFPRTAMLGLPPPEQSCDWAKSPEVLRGLIPNGFSAGNVISAQPDQLPNLVHGDAGRCAAPGLRLPRLAGGEKIRLIGMQVEQPIAELVLPAERPVFGVPGVGEVHTSLFQVFIDVEEARCTLLWAGHWSAPAALGEEERAQLTASIVTKVEATEKSS